MTKLFRILTHSLLFIPLVALANVQDSICLVGKLDNAPEVGWDKLKTDQWKAIYTKAGYVIDEVKDESVGSFYVVYHPREFGKSLYAGLSKLYDRMAKGSEKDGGCIVTSLIPCRTKRRKLLLVTFGRCLACQQR